MTIGLFFMAWFFVYEVTSTKYSRNIIKVSVFYVISNSYCRKCSLLALQQCLWVLERCSYFYGLAFLCEIWTLAIYFDFCCYVLLLTYSWVIRLTFII